MLKNGVLGRSEGGFYDDSTEGITHIWKNR